MLASNFSLDEYLSHQSLGDAPGSRQPPFSVGSSVSGPICPVMVSCCLSAGSLRFLTLPFPTEEFSFPYGWLTQDIDHPWDLIGVTLFRMCEKQSVRMPSLLRGLGVRSRGNWDHGDHCPIIIASAVAMTPHDAASSKVHLRSSFPFSPCPVASFGSKLP